MKKSFLGKNCNLKKKKIKSIGGIYFTVISSGNLELKSVDLSGRHKSYQRDFLSVTKHSLLADSISVWLRIHHCTEFGKLNYGNGNPCGGTNNSSITNAMKPRLETKMRP